VKTKTVPVLELGTTPAKRIHCLIKHHAMKVLEEWWYSSTHS